ncbi:MAG TPA: YdeI/OmpD-associated family protein [Verrucomicrobiae bacterium]
MDCSRARTHDPAEWLETCPEFSWPLAEKIHEWILTWEPDLTESIKWNMLCFTGRKLVCGISACKKHLGITFFRGTELPDPAKLFTPEANNTNIRSIRVTTLEGFNREAFRELVHAAVALDADPEAVPVPKLKPGTRAPWPIPDYFAAGLKKNKKANDHFQKLAPSCQREYIVWLATAKRPETQAKRLKETLGALSKGYKWIDRKKG